MRNKKLVLAMSVIALAGVAGGFVLFAGHPARDGASNHAAWTEVQWPFPMDEWGKGKAYQCKAADCGGEVNLYLRAKIGFCNCTTGVADDEELERVSDFDLVGGDLSPLGAGHQVTIGWMNGRSRSYTISAPNRRGKTAISVAFSDRCDAIVAIIFLPHDRPATIEPSVIDFLGSRIVMRWAQTTLGL